MQQISLDLDKENELIFKISIEGTKPAHSRSRFLLESSDYSLVFPASSFSNGEVSVVIPTLEKVLSEGNYSGTLEVIVDDRVFEPIKIDTEFKKSLKVVAESVVKKREETTVSVESDVIVNKSRASVERKQLIQESPTRKTVQRPQQRNRKHPKKLIKSRAEEPISITESRDKKSPESIVRKISEKHGIMLTESQIKRVLGLYRAGNKRKDKK